MHSFLEEQTDPGANEPENVANITEAEPKGKYRNLALSFIYA